MTDRADIPLHACGWSIASVNDHIVLASGYLVGPRANAIVYRGSLTPHPVRKGKRREIFKYRLFSRLRHRRRMDRATWICRPNAVNYFHWLIETLPRLYCLSRIGWSEPIVIGDHLMQ